MPDDQQASRPTSWQPPPGPPPATAAPAAAAPPVDPQFWAPRRAPRGLAVTTTVASVVFALVQLGSWVTSWSASADLVRMADTGTDVLEGPLFTYDLVNMALLPAMVAAYVVGCLWLQRARSNAELASPAWPHARGPAWVWLGWWVPVVSLWFPFQVTRDVRAGTLRDRSSGQLGLWWAAWLVFLVGTQVAARLAPVSGVPDASLARALPWAETVATVGMLVALVLWLRIVQQVTAAQRLWDRPA